MYTQDALGGTPSSMNAATGSSAVEYGGAIYMVMQDGSGGGYLLHMFKSTDGGRTWAEQDAAGRPGGADRFGHVSYKNGTNFYVWASDATGSNQLALQYTFDLTTDTWDAGSVSTGMVPIFYYRGRIVKRGATDFLFVIEHRQRIMGTYYTRPGFVAWNGTTTYGVPTLVEDDSATLAAYTVYTCAGPDDSGRTYVWYAAIGKPRWIRAILSGDTLGTGGNMGGTPNPSNGYENTVFENNIYVHSGNVYKHAAGDSPLSGWTEETLGVTGSFVYADNGLTYSAPPDSRLLLLASGTHELYRRSASGVWTEIAAYTPEFTSAVNVGVHQDSIGPYIIGAMQNNTDNELIYAEIALEPPQINNVVSAQQHQLHPAYLE